MYNDKPIKTFFCPENKCQKALIAEISRSARSIHFMLFDFTDNEIAQALAEKNKGGVEVRGIMETRNAKGRWSQYGFLIENGVDVVMDENPHNLHHKVFIIDEQTVITGSYNPTKNANTRNDENLLIIDDRNLALAFLEEFEVLRSLTD
jgi:phosphatidylserine/phosphatidylglycerophosphate/cardiolipin synthase-like enzyme